MKIALLRILVISLFPWWLHGQSAGLQVFANSGNNFGAYGSYTIGEVFTNTLDNTVEMVSQGFHQPQMTATGIPGMVWDLEANLFPNPTAGKCSLDFSGKWNGKINLTVTSVMGQILIERKDLQFVERLELDLSPFANGMYLLTLSTSNYEPISYFRIEKIDY